MRRALKWGGALLLAVCLLAVAADRIWPPPPMPPMGREILDREGRLLAVLPAPGGVWRFATSPSEVSPDFIRLLLHTEDRWFWAHPGIDPPALARAAWQWARAGHVVSGGSTLTMQVVRLLEHRPRTVRSKAIEIARALQLEAHYSKADILGMWLSLAPYGGNLEGVRAGALAWFGVPPNQLDPAQSALLVAIPRRPEALRPDRHARAALAVRNRVLASNDPVPTRRLPMPQHAPQILRGLPLDQARIVTTLDLPLQIALEDLAKARLRDLPERASIALLVGDLKTREIRALVAGVPVNSPDREARAGALDLSQALRSPGSALKPFLYALAFQDGLASPESRLDDLPRHFGGYAPENFDRGHSGPVTAAEALRESLNLPAVALLDRLGPGRFAASLRAAGARLVLPAGADPSLPLALGGVGTDLRDLASLYAALATDGTARGLALVAGATTSRPFLQPQAARLVADVITQPFPGGGAPGVAWKTGTSWGGRDAWSFGFDAAHVAGVWVGRPDGTPLPGATGRTLALPVLAEMFDLLPAAPRAVAAPRPPAPPQTAVDTLRLLFPPPGAVLSADGNVPLRAMGGQRPLTFLVDGMPIGSDLARRQAMWLPDGPGFYAITVLDASGAAVRASVRVR